MRKWYWHAIFLLFIIVTGWSYWPSLKHAPKHDQLGYLAETALYDGNAWKTIPGAMTLNRDRTFMAGDLKLYRPVLYLWLGWQRVLYGYDVTRWQLTAMVVHGLVGILLYAFLLSIGSCGGAVFFAGFFLLMVSNVPMVVWHHLSAYMLFCALFLGALREWWLYAGERRERRLWHAVFFMTPAVFLFEAGVLFCLVLAVVAGVSQKNRKAFIILLLPGILYAFFYLIYVFFGSGGADAEFSKIGGRFLSLRTLVNMALAVKWFLTTGLFSGGKDILLMGRVVLAPWTLNVAWPFPALTPQVIRGGSLVCLLAVLACRLRAWEYPARRQLLTVLGGCLLFFILLIITARVNARGVVAGLVFNSYYTYIFWVFFLPLCYVLVEGVERSFDREGVLLKTAIYGCLLSIIFISAPSIRNTNVMIATLDKSRLTMITTLDRFVRQHKDEPDFSFGISHSCPGAYPGKWLHRKGAPLWARETMASALFPRYYRTSGEKYRLDCPGNY